MYIQYIFSDAFIYEGHIILKLLIYSGQWAM